MGNAAFFAPDIRTWPESRVPPSMRSLSKAAYAPPARRHSSGVIARIESA